MSRSKSNISCKKGGRRPGTTNPNTTLSAKLRGMFPDKTLAQVAKYLGVTGEAARNYLAGNREPTSKVLASLHAATNVDLTWLLNDSDTRSGPVFSATQAESPSAAPAKVKNTAEALVDSIEPAVSNHELLRLNEAVANHLAATGAVLASAGQGKLPRIVALTAIQEAGNAMQKVLESSAPHRR